MKLKSYYIWCFKRKLKYLRGQCLKNVFFKYIVDYLIKFGTENIYKDLVSRSIFWYVVQYFFSSGGVCSGFKLNNFKEKYDTPLVFLEQKLHWFCLSYWAMIFL